MTTVNVQLLLHYVLIICIEKFDETKAQIRYESYENRSVPKSRQIYYSTRLSRENPSPTDLPVAFQAPDFRSQNYWNYHNRNHSARRTFLGDWGYFGYRKPDPNTFYDFMNSFIDKGNIFKEPRPASPEPVSEPYPYEYPYDVYPGTERNFLPPPKPIRASIVKLETVTGGPEPFTYVDPPTRPPDFRPIPTSKPYFNGFHIDELGFHPARNINFESESPSYPPIAPGKSNTSNNLNSTVYMPTSALVNFQKVKIPFATEDEPFRAPTTTSKKPSTARNITDHSEREPNVDNTANLEPAPRFNDSKSKSDFGYEETLDRESKNDTFVEYKKLESGSEESIINETKKAVKKIKSDKITNSIKIVTELTLEGLSKNKTEMVNIPSYTKFINMSGLINYELDKLKQNKIIKPRWDVAGEKESANETSAIDPNYFLSPSVNSNDDLSLDIKILKDTNWDGFITEIPPTTETDSIEFNSGDGYDKSKQFFTPRENPFLHSNSSDSPNNTENEVTIRKLHDNKTIIVETRVTKSISKKIPGSRNRTLENETPTIKDYSTSASEKSDGTKEILIKEILDDDDDEKDNASNETIKIEQKDFNMYRESDIVRHFNRTQSVNPTPKTTLQTVVHNARNADVVESSLENFNNYTTYTSTIRGESALSENKTDREIIKQVRKRKHKRLRKNKRRRTGKRRQTNSTATQVDNPIKS